jgi:hypothetical protein
VLVLLVLLERARITGFIAALITGMLHLIRGVNIC